jgi:CubicO group peptidase (beta-lactamase class C family)
LWLVHTSRHGIGSAQRRSVHRSQRMQEISRATDELGPPDGIWLEHLQASLQEYDVPGVALSILAGDQEFEFIRGWADPSANIKLDRNMRFDLGCLYKPYIALMVQRLLGEQGVPLSAGILEALPRSLASQFRPIWARVEFNDLLRHQAGLQDELDQQDWELWSAEDLLAACSEASVFVAEPGECVSYSSLGYRVLLAAAEILADLSIGELMDTFVFSELNLRSSSWATQHDASKHLVGHALGPSGIVPRPAVHTLNPVPRTVFATASDVARFARASAEAYPPLQHTDMVYGSGPVWNMTQGVGWWRATWSERNVFFHAGIGNGFVVQCLAIPSGRFAYAFCTNSIDGELIWRQLMVDLCYEFAGVEVATVPQTAGLLDDFEQWAGIYANGREAYRVAVGPQRSSLRATPVRRRPGFSELGIPAAPLDLKPLANGIFRRGNGYVSFDEESKQAGWFDCWQRRYARSE